MSFFDALGLEDTDMSDKIDIRTYVSDMITVEHHILQPVKKQLEEDEVAGLPAAKTVLTKIKDLLELHISDLDEHLASLGGHPASGLKAGVGDTLGALAAAVQDFRKTKLSKGLRDDYAALSLAAVAYEMLYTTPLSLGSQETAELAIRHLKDITSSIMDLTRLVVDVVVAELFEINPTLDNTVGEKSKQAIIDAWRPDAVTV